MAEFIRLPNLIVNLSPIREIRFLDDTVLIYWQGGEISTLVGSDAAVLLNVLEQRYGLMTDPTARLSEEEETSIA